MGFEKIEFSGAWLAARGLFWRLVLLLCTGLMLFTALLPLYTAIAADPVFSPRILERAMLDLYCQFPGQAAGACPGGAPERQLPQPGNPAPRRLTPNNLNYWALEIFDQAALLGTDEFNDVITHMAADYHQHPEHRAAIELVLGSIAIERSAGVGGPDDHTADAVRAKLREEIAQISNHNVVLDVMEGIMVAFTAAYTFEFGKGILNGGRTLWVSGGEGITRLERFKQIGRLWVESDKLAKNAVAQRKLITFAAGTGLGLAEAAIRSFSVYKIDPRHALEPVQADIVHGKALRAARDRDEIRGMAADTLDNLRARALAYRERIAKIDDEATQIQSELEHLYDVAAHLRPQMEPIAQDLNEIHQKFSFLSGKLDELQSGTGLR